MIVECPISGPGDVINLVLFYRITLMQVNSHALIQDKNLCGSIRGEGGIFYVLTAGGKVPAPADYRPKKQHFATFFLLLLRLHCCDDLCPRRSECTSPFL
jgi:hypothetical protein